MARKLPEGFVPVVPVHGEPCEDAKRLAEAIQELIDTGIDPLDFHLKHQKRFAEHPGVVEYDHTHSKWIFADGSYVHTWARFGGRLRMAVRGPVVRMAEVRTVPAGTY